MEKEIFKLRTSGFRETQKLAKNLACFLKGSEVIGLIGELGGGKTTFVKGLVTGLGIKEKITSPTFVLMKQYPIPKLKTQKSRLYHIDLYRIKDSQEAYSFGFDEVLQDEKAIVVIEWADKITEFLPKEKLIIKFNFFNKNKREIEFKAFGKKYQDLILKLSKKRLK